MIMMIMRMMMMMMMMIMMIMVMTTKLVMKMGMIIMLTKFAMVGKEQRNLINKHQVITTTNLRLSIK